MIAVVRGSPGPALFVTDRSSPPLKAVKDERGDLRSLIVRGREARTQRRIKNRFWLRAVIITGMPLALIAASHRHRPAKGCILLD